MYLFQVTRKASRPSSGFAEARAPTAYSKTKMENSSSLFWGVIRLYCNTVLSGIGDQGFGMPSVVENKNTLEPLSDFAESEG